MRPSTDFIRVFGHLEMSSFSGYRSGDKDKGMRERELSPRGISVPQQHGSRLMAKERQPVIGGTESIPSAKG